VKLGRLRRVVEGKGRIAGSNGERDNKTTGMLYSRGSAQEAVLKVSTKIRGARAKKRTKIISVPTAPTKTKKPPIRKKRNEPRGGRGMATPRKGVRAAGEGTGKAGRKDMETTTPRLYSLRRDRKGKR